MRDQNTRDTENGAIKDPAEWTTGDEPMTGRRTLTSTPWPARPAKRCPKL